MASRSTAYTELLDGITKKRTTNSVSSINAFPVASDDYLWRDEDGLPIYSVVWNAGYPVGGITEYQTRSLADAIRLMHNMPAERMQAEIRSGGVPLVSREDMRSMTAGVSLPDKAVPWAVLNTVTIEDRKRFEARNPAVPLMGYAAQLDPLPRTATAGHGRIVNNIPLTEPMEDILRSAERRGLPDYEIRRLENFASFTQATGQSANSDEVEQAWDRTVRQYPSQEALDAAWKTRKAEMLQEAKDRVRLAASSASKRVVLVGSLLRSAWKALVVEAVPDGGPGQEPAVKGYASAILDASKAWPEAKNDLPGYQNAYIRGRTLQEHLLYATELPRQAEYSLVPILSDMSRGPVAFEALHDLPVDTLFDAFKYARDNGAGSLTYQGKSIDLERVRALCDAVTGLTPEGGKLAAQKAGAALYDLFSLVKGGVEDKLAVLTRLSVRASITQNTETRSWLIDGFESAMQTAPRSEDSPRLTSLLDVLARYSEQQGVPNIIVPEPQPDMNDGGSRATDPAATAKPSHGSSQPDQVAKGFAPVAVTEEAIAGYREGRECSRDEASKALGKQALVESLVALRTSGTLEDKIDWLISRYAESMGLEPQPQPQPQPSGVTPAPAVDTPPAQSAQSHGDAVQADVPSVPVEAPTVSLSALGVSDRPDMEAPDDFAVDDDDYNDASMGLGM